VEHNIADRVFGLGHIFRNKQGVPRSITVLNIVRKIGLLDLANMNVYNSIQVCLDSSAAISDDRDALNGSIIFNRRKVGIWRRFSSLSRRKRVPLALDAKYLSSGIYVVGGVSSSPTRDLP
jgi:hypothetical protein